MRKRFELQYELGARPLEEARFPKGKSRDSLTKALRALQHIYLTPELNTKVFDLLEERVCGHLARTGRPGMSLWEILVLGVTRMVLDIDYDRLHHIANCDILVREMMGLTTSWGDNLKEYSYQSLKDNIGLLDEETLEAINALVVGEGYRLKKTPEEKILLTVKVDSYVLESNVHFPTDINLLWDAARKSLDLIGYLIHRQPGTGWRKYRDWQKRVRSHFQAANRIMTRGGRNHQTHFAAAVLVYLKLSRQLSTKLKDSKEALWAIAEGSERREECFDQLEYYEAMLDKHIGLVRRRVIFKENIPHDQKVFSLFEPYVRWVNKGKSGGRIELGLPISIATDQFGFILAHRVMETETDVDMAIPIAEAALGMGKVDSMSFDRGYWSPDNYRKLAHRVRLLVMPKKGGRDKREAEREGNREFQRLRRQHAAVESDINALEHHGLNRCPDRGLIRFRRYTALGILALNLHRLGNLLIEQDRAPTRRCRAAA